MFKSFEVDKVESALINGVFSELINIKFEDLRALKNKPPNKVSLQALRVMVNLLEKTVTPEIFEHLISEKDLALR